MNINKAIIKALYEARKDDTFAIKSFIEETEKIFHNTYLYLQYNYWPNSACNFDHLSSNKRKRCACCIRNCRQYIIFRNFDTYLFVYVSNDPY